MRVTEEHDHDLAVEIGKLARLSGEIGELQLAPKSAPETSVALKLSEFPERLHPASTAQTGAHEHQEISPRRAKAKDQFSSRQ
jgi:hypothetical protein